MDYFFDESGNWQIPGSEKNRLVLGGLWFQHPDVERNLLQDLKILLAKERLDQLHATDLTPARRERCYELLNEHLHGNAKALVRTFPPNLLAATTRGKADETYIVKAAGLVRVLTLGDQEIHLFWDNKFYYAYPLNVLRNMNRLPWYVKKIREMMVLDPLQQGDLRDQLVQRLKKQLVKGDTFQQKPLQSFLERITPRVEGDPLDPDFLKEEEKARAGAVEAIADYYWSEMWQQVFGYLHMQDKLKNTVLSELDQIQYRLGMKQGEPALKLTFIDKQANRAGIVAIDLICNLVYRMSLSGAGHPGSEEKKLLDWIVLEEYPS